MKYKVRDIRLAKKGQISHEWAKNHMPILERTLDRFRKTKPLKGITIGFCLHITKETSVLLLGAKELGATVVACGGAQDDIAAFLVQNVDGKTYSCIHTKMESCTKDRCRMRTPRWFMIAPGKLEGTVVECPLHFWHYDIKTGKLLDYQKGIQLQKYDVKEENGEIYIDV